MRTPSVSALSAPPSSQVPATQLPDDMVVDVDAMAPALAAHQRQREQEASEAREAAQWRARTENTLEHLGNKLELVNTKLQDQQQQQLQHFHQQLQSFNQLQQQMQQQQQQQQQHQLQQLQQQQQQEQHRQEQQQKQQQQQQQEQQRQQPIVVADTSALEAELKAQFLSVQQEMQKMRRETKRLKKTVTEAQIAQIPSQSQQPVLFLPPQPASPPPQQTQVDVSAILETIQVRHFVFLQNVFFFFFFCETKQTQQNMEDIVGRSERKLHKEVKALESRVMEGIKRGTAATISASAQTKTIRRSPKIHLTPRTSNTPRVLAISQQQPQQQQPQQQQHRAAVVPSPASFYRPSEKRKKSIPKTPATMEVAQFRKDLFRKMLE
jgi:hypothetical protein